MITPRQIRAARGLLGWDAIELGKRTRLSRDTVANIESGRTRAREGSLERIIKVFDGAGVKFTENEGVGIKPNGIETFIGEERFHAFTEFVYDYLRQYGGDVCISAVNEALLNQYRKDWPLYKTRLQALVKRGDVTIRSLTTESNAPTAFCAFGDCLALISFDHAPAPYVVLHKSGAFSEAYREAFDAVWDNDEPPQQELTEKSA